MRYLPALLAFCLLLSVFACQSASEKQATAQANLDIDIHQLAALLGEQSRKPPLLLDVRTPKEYRNGHLKGAVLIPMKRLKERLKELDHNSQIIIYCAVGGRSKSAQYLMTAEGFKDNRNLLGGIIAWQKAGYPVEQ